MFIGHIALGMGAKRYAPRTSLGLLIAAPIFADLLWPTLLLLGIEQVRIDPGNTKMTPLDFVHYPWSHSLLMLCVWGALIGGALFLASRWRADAWIVAALVVSHWFLDLPMHRADLPLWPGASSPKVGWGLWNSIPATYVIEFAIYAIGIAIYLRATRARDRVGSWGLWVYILVLAILYVMSNGSPPPNERVLAWTALGIWLFVPWAWWIDKHREYVGRIKIPIERPTTF